MSIDTRQGTRTRSQRTAAQRATAQRATAPQREAVQTSAPAGAPFGPDAIGTSHETIRAGVVESAAHDELVLERVTPDVLRVTLDDRVLGFVEYAGRVHVALAGERYDRAVEVAQALDVTEAARALA
jgi:hypothetical protein